MLEKIGIENFKAFGKYREVSLSKLNIITGLNSAGKSTIYHAILLLMQSQGKYINYDNNRVACLDINGTHVQLGGYDELMHDPQKGYIRFVLYWNDGTKTDSFYKLKKTERSENTGKKTSFVLDQFEMSKNGIVIIKVKKYKTKKGWLVEAFQLLTFSPGKIDFLLQNNVTSYSESRREGRMKEFYLDRVIFRNVLDVYLSAYSLEGFYIKFEDVDKSINKKFRDKIEWEKLKEDFKKEEIDTDTVCLFNSNSFDHKTEYGLDDSQFEVLWPFRGHPQRLYIESDHPNPMGKYLEKKDEIENYVYDFERKCARTDTIKKAFHYWIVNHFKIAEFVDVKEILPDIATEIILTIDGKNIPLNHVGFGVSQLIPVVFAVLSSDKKKLCIVDEPEIHLHPSLQSKLADFFLHMALIGKRIFVETHSEYLIDKLIYLKLKHSIDDKDIRLIWVKKGEKGCYVEDVKYDDLGYIINPPEGFLSEKKKLVKELSEIRLLKL